MSFDLFLHDRLAQGTGYFGNITRHGPDWRRTIRAVGGNWQGGFTITLDTMSEAGLTAFFDSAIGRRVVESYSGLTTWEGKIVQLDLFQNGVTYTRSLNPEKWFNRVAVKYGDTATTWSENTSSSDIYGESWYLDPGMLEFDVASATAEQAKLLAKYAFPNSRVTGGLGTETPTNQPGSLRVQCAGYVFSMNRRYYEADIAAGDRSVAIATLVAASEFVTAGSIDTNTDNIAIECAAIPARLWDQIQTVIDSGDDSGADWVGGVYAGRRFNYNLAETEVTHYWTKGQLLDRGKRPVPAIMVKPDIVVQVGNAPLLGTPPGGRIIDNPRNVYIEAVEFIAPNGFQLILAEDLV